MPGWSIHFSHSNLLPLIKTENTDDYLLLLWFLQGKKGIGMLYITHLKLLVSFLLF